MPLEKHFESFVPPPGRLIAACAASRSPGIPASLPLRNVCRIVRQMVGELVPLFGDRVMLRRDRRRLSCHVRQIAMYVCHVVLRISMSDIGEAFGRDRTTVGHACHVVEDRRDDPAFDDFVSAVERIVTVVFGMSEVPAHE
ncbi:hypothetical protein J2046_002079 [Rhizobium petrolearium]|uniref:helix-turn-helix domain-containing protein n=1 Tax=Neorhizobium petrolearium TaxID=515361 RepID=UPI001F23AB94|nr:helix-turn-helix domain-containing protein [Neorhizobium petrolearium]MBP1843823.1 hypothetical protein [Neorhizobium petrolearium]